MGVKRGFVVRTAAAGLLALAGIAAGMSGASASTVSHVSKSCTGTGGSATCEAEATFTSPASMSFTITATPNQEIAGGWDDDCFSGTKSGSDKAGFSGITPLTLTVKHAYAHPSICVIAVDAQLVGDSGKSIHVVVNAPAVAAPAIRGGVPGGCVNDANDSSANGTKIQLWSCNGQGQQDWSYTKDKLVHNGRCLTDAGDGGPGTGLILNGCSSAEDDLWVHTSSGEYVHTGPGGKLCLTAPAAKKGTQLTVAACKNAASQRWTLP
jgi:Ricin-type beta-trefoil lectin domain